jgi:hypothetical protein
MGRAWERRGMHTEFLVRKPDGKKPLGIARCEWDDNIKNYLIVIGWGSI